AGPIILIDLPSMGANQQISNVDTGLSAGTLELEDLAAMLGRWLEQMQLPQVTILGMSLGSVVASCLADQRPELVERMILMGVMQKTRKS
ncbi:alpha/beta hydrolase, partial [Klebsiella pneumoniae]|nr:alpha/beta hydrolase [Klebsiella pneumoniae]